jgi:hypothetical protein
VPGYDRCRPYGTLPLHSRKRGQSTILDSEGLGSCEVRVVWVGASFAGNQQRIHELRDLYLAILASEELLNEVANRLEVGGN